VVHGSPDRPLDFDSHSATPRPRFTIDPAYILVNIGECVPLGVIGENLPGETTTSISND
jgi:hypothetical protein